MVRPSDARLNHDYNNNSTFMYHKETAKKSTSKRGLDPVQQLARRAAKHIRQNVRTTPCPGQGVGKGNQIRIDRNRVVNQDAKKNEKRGRKRVPPGVAALKEIRNLQRSTGLLIPRISFQRVVREILTKVSPIEHKFQTAGLLALQEATEAFVIRLMENATLATIHARRVTLFPQDIGVVRRILL